MPAHATIDCHGLRPRSDDSLSLGPPYPVIASEARQAMAPVPFRPHSHCNTQYPMQPAVYILAGQPRGTLYVGVTSNLIQRVWQHKNNLAEGFTRKYGVHSLVYFELHATMYDAIHREKQLKAGSRAKKVALIEAMNPNWGDLYGGVL